MEKGLMRIEAESVTALLVKLDEIDDLCCRGIMGNARATLTEIKGISAEIRNIAGGFRPDIKKA